MATATERPPAIPAKAKAAAGVSACTNGPATAAAAATPGPRARAVEWGVTEPRERLGLRPGRGEAVDHGVDDRAGGGDGGPGEQDDRAHRGQAVRADDQC